MKLNKRVIESVAVLGLAGVLTIASVTSADIQVATKSVDVEPATVQEENVVADTSLENDGLAGVSATLYKYQTADVVVDVAEDEVAVVASAEDEEKEVTEEPVETELTAEEQEWQDKLMAKVDESLNVRTEASEDSEIVGKLYKGDRALVVEVGDTWTKIESGSVIGYVKNDFCLTGSEALSYAKKTCDTVAKVNIDGLRIRSEANTEASVVDAVGTGTKLKVDTKAEVSDEWVAVKYNDKTCYVSAEYVTLALDTGKAITIEEEIAAKAAEEAAMNEDNGGTSAGGSSQPDSPSVENGSSIAVDADDFTLLSAIIMCEAGGESYQCQLGIGAVVCNRVKSGAYPNNIRDVIYQRGQFGPASSGKLARTIKSGNISSTAKKAAKAALSGQDNTKGAIGFKYYTKGAKGVRIGCVLFFK